MISLSVQVEAQALALAVKRYAELRKMTPAQALDRQGRELAFYLSAQFRRIIPARNSILAAAMQRKWRLGRKSESGDLSPESYRLADEIMEGHPVIWGRVVQGHGAAGILRTIRVGKRGGRITGGRSGRGGRAATPEEAQRLRVAGEKPLNRRAVANYFEVMRRETGRGYLAASLMPFRRRRNRASERAAGRAYSIVENSTSRTSYPWRRAAALKETPEGATFELHAKAEGLGKHQQLIAAGIARARANVLEYVLTREARAAALAGLAASTRR